MPANRARALRNNPTPAERALWKIPSAVRPRFTRQLQLDPFYADLACRRARTIVEVDGSQHAESAADATRTAILERRGWRVLRLWNNAVLENPEGAVEYILTETEPRLPSGETFTFTTPRHRKPKE